MTNDVNSPALPSDLNQWFLSLPPERQAILKEDKWMLANAAFEAGKAIAEENAKPLIGYRYVARRADDGSAWAGMFYCGGYAFAHAQSMKEAVHAKTLETLEEAMWKGLCHYPDDGMGEQANGRYSIYKVANGRIAQVVAEGYVPGQAYFQSKPFWVDSPFALNSFYDDFRHLVKNVKAAKLGIRDTPKWRNDEAWQGHWLDICRMSRIATVLLPDDDTANLKPVTQADFEAAVGRVIEATDVGWSDGASVQDRVQEPLRELAALIMRGARLDGVELSISGYDPSAAIVPSKKKKGAA